MNLTIGVTASKRRLATLVSPFSHGLPICFLLFSALHTVHPRKVAPECNYEPLRSIFDYVSVNFWWSLAGIRYVISYPKR